MSGVHFGVTESHEVQMAVDVTRYYAGWADKNHGQTIEVRVLHHEDDAVTNTYCH